MTRTLLEEQYAFRDELVECLRQDTVGPVGGEDEVIDDPPSTAYIAGILFPLRDTSAAARSVRDEQDVDLTSVQKHDLPGADDIGVSMANTQQPSAMGLTFAADPSGTTAVVVVVEAAVYDPIDGTGAVTGAKQSRSRSTDDSPQRWRRRPLAIEPTPVAVHDSGESRCEVSPGLELRVRVRPVAPDGSVAVTVTLVNVREFAGSGLRDGHCFFQPRLVIRSEGGPGLVERPLPGGSDSDEDVAAARLLYRHAPTFATGHGCAAEWDWSPPPAGVVGELHRGPAAVAEVRTTFAPTFEVLRTESNPELDSARFSMLGLAEMSVDELETALTGLTDGYAAWIGARSADAAALRGTRYEPVAARQVGMCRQVLDRIRSGTRLLMRDPDALEAFRLANRAMAEQRSRTAWIKADRSGDPRHDGRWRPFQIAFVILCLEGIVHEKHPDRGTADLLWFPTGGGKTEAYLGLIAFTVFLRRLRGGEHGGGVTVLMRYTLRLLTLQQFERAATLMCAMDLIRRGDPERFGHETMSIGMWVGRGATPNTLEETRTSLDALIAGKVLTEMNPVQLRACPWCGTAMDAHDYAVDLKASRMSITCADPSCPFAAGLPVHVVDQEVYRVRPTLVIATVDKFAALPWRAAVAELFNLNTPGTPPPELVVQDELHLISGPLGTLVGLYETVTDVLAQEPKVIASTATIRRAGEQVKRIFDRDICQFPPAGLDMRDSWFAVQSPGRSRASRCYVGLLTPSTSQATLLVRAYAALLHHGAVLPGDDAVRDPYWTLVGYFNSLRLLAAADLQVRDDVDQRIRQLAERNGVEARDIPNLTELTSRVGSSEIPGRLKDLDRHLPDPGSPDVVLATNMISVGVDIDRLGVMAVTGQPQTTAEYIQATSRIGRRHPGLVVTLFNGARSRDRSHYENFQTYHSALYRQVESTSVTPFSPRARDRALHAVLVALTRLTTPAALPNEAARDVATFTHRLSEARERIAARGGAVEPAELAGTYDHLDEITAWWSARAEDHPDSLCYEAPWTGTRRDPSVPAVLGAFGDPHDNGRPTLWSLRDVDVESYLYLES